MKNNHILNIGYPKCGTTWCWEVLTQQSWFSAPREKENTDLITGVTVAEYINSYQHYDITANFGTVNFALDRYVIKQLSELPTVTVSLILRNPFDLQWSMYNFMPNDANTNYNSNFVNLINQSWFTRTSHIIKRWQQYFDSTRFHIFFYDDIKENCNLFFDKYCHLMNLPNPIIQDAKPVNKTRYVYTQNSLDPSVVAIINQEIENLQSCVEYDVLKWRQL
jgi:hypothetical protein